MKEDELYDLYRRYLETKFNGGALSLLMISENYFESFKYKINTEELFALSLRRDKKINDIIEENR